MSVEINLKIDTRELDLFLTRNSVKQVSAAVARALDRTIVTVRKEAAQKIRQQIKLPVRDIKEALKVRKQYGPNQPLGSQVGFLLSSAAPISLSRFKPRQVRTGVRVNITGRPQIIPHAFLAKMPNASKPAVFRRIKVEKSGRSIKSKRVGPNRSELPIRKQATQGINRVLAQIAPDLQKTAAAVFYPRFNHEFARRVKT